MAKDFATTIRYLAEPVIDGTINPNYGDPYAWNAAEKSFGKERVKKAVRDYRQDNPRFKNWRY